MAERMVDIPTDLVKALQDIVDCQWQTPTPVELVALYLEKLAREYGLSESVENDPLERAQAFPELVDLIAHYLPETLENNADNLTNRLHAVFVSLSQDPESRKSVNKKDSISSERFLQAAQVYWNIESNSERRLPLGSGDITLPSGKSAKASIKVPGADLDFATMNWTERTGYKGEFKSTGQAFRNQGARLAVLAARAIVESADQQFSTAGFTYRQREQGSNKIELVLSRQHASSQNANEDAPARPVVLGSPASIGTSYLRRDIDAQVDEILAGESQRVVLLRGAPGFGKSHIARRVWSEAQQQSELPQAPLLIWVDSANASSLRHVLSAAADLMPQLNISVQAQANDRIEQQSTQMIRELEVSDWPWLIVLDNADAESIAETGILGAGKNPRGQIIVSTNSANSKISRFGRVIEVGAFSEEESVLYLRNMGEVHGESRGALSAATNDQFHELARALGGYPLALSISAATILENHLTVEEWLREFRAGVSLDEVADSQDPEGYPHSVAQVWRLALDRVSQEFPREHVQRAATVAALLDPDGHPARLWADDSVLAWIGGGNDLAMKHGKPAVLSALVNHSILGFSPNRITGGSVNIHGIAAHAILEGQDSQTLDELAGLLVEALWMLCDHSRLFDKELIANLDRLVLARMLSNPAKAKAHEAKTAALANLFEFESAYETCLQAVKVLGEESSRSLSGLKFLAVFNEIFTLLGKELPSEIADSSLLLAVERLIETEKDGDPSDLAGLHVIATEISDRLQNQANAKRHFQAAKAATMGALSGSGLSSPRTEFDLQMNMSILEKSILEYEESLKWVNEALVTAKSLGDRELEFRATMLRLGLAPEMLDFDELEIAVQEMLAISAELSDGKNFYAGFVTLMASQGASVAPDFLPDWVSGPNSDPSMTERVENFSKLIGLEAASDLAAENAKWERREEVFDNFPNMEAAEQVSVLRELIFELGSEPESMADSVNLLMFQALLAMTLLEDGKPDEAKSTCEVGIELIGQTIEKCGDARPSGSGQAKLNLAIRMVWTAHLKVGEFFVENTQDFDKARECFETTLKRRESTSGGSGFLNRPAELLQVAEADMGLIRLARANQDLDLADEYRSKFVEDLTAAVTCLELEDAEVSREKFESDPDLRMWVKTIKSAFQMAIFDASIEFLTRDSDGNVSLLLPEWAKELNENVRSFFVSRDLHEKES